MSHLSCGWASAPRDSFLLLFVESPALLPNTSLPHPDPLHSLTLAVLHRLPAVLGRRPSWFDPCGSPRATLPRPSERVLRAEAPGWGPARPLLFKGDQSDLYWKQRPRCVSERLPVQPAMPVGEGWLSPNAWEVGSYALPISSASDGGCWWE